MNRRNFIKESVIAALASTGFLQSASVWAQKTLPGFDRLPSLFLVGDSISIQYTQFLKQYLKGVVEFDRKQDDGGANPGFDVPDRPNSGDSRMALAYVTSKFSEPSFRPDYLLLNCGLHDIKRNEENHLQVEEENYRQNLQSIVDITREHGSQLIWIRTTPVVDEIHNSRPRLFKRFARDLDRYNRIADTIMTGREIPMIDLFGFTERLGQEVFRDHVHYKEPARQLQAAYIAGALQSIWDKQGY